MPNPTDPEVSSDAPSRTATAGVAAASLLEGFGRETLITGTVLFSLIVAVGGPLTGEPLWLVVGLAVGLAGLVSAVLTLGRKWTVRRTWTVLPLALLADIAVMFGMWSGAAP